MASGARAQEVAPSRPSSADGRPCRPRRGPWYCGWPVRTRGGGIGGSPASWASSGCGYRHRRSVGCSTNPTGGWVTQQARNVGLDLEDRRTRVVIRDRDSKYTGALDEVFRTHGIRIVRTPVRAPRANAIAERFVRTVRTECLDGLLILNRRHLERVLRLFDEHYNTQRPHRALELQPPQRAEPPPPPAVGEIRRYDRLGGLIHEYYRDAA